MSNAEPCACLDQVNEKLAETGHHLQSTMFGKPDIPLIMIMRSDTWAPEKRRGRPSTFAPSHCPFCGVKYPTGAGSFAASPTPKDLK